MKTSIKSLLLLFAIIPFLTGCGSLSEKSYRYMAVQLSNAKEKWSIVDIKDGSIVVENDIPSEPTTVIDGMYFVKNKEGNYELFNAEKPDDPVVNKEFKMVTPFGNGAAIVCERFEELSIIDKKGEEKCKLPSTIVGAWTFRNGCAMVVDHETSLGFVNTDGKFIIKPMFSAAYNFSKDGYVVGFKHNVDGEYKDECYVADDDGGQLMKFPSDKYQVVLSEFINGVIAVTEKGTIVYLDKDGQRKLKAGELKGADRYDYIGDGYHEYNPDFAVYDDMAVFVDDDLYGVKTLDGEVVISAKYEKITPIGNGNFIVKKDGKFMIIDKDGERLTEDDFALIYKITEERFIAQSKPNGNYYLIDEHGDDVGEEQFKNIKFGQDFSKSIARDDNPEF